jgi:hypothetical protein
MSAPYKLTEILPQSIQARRRIEATIEVVFEQEVYNADMWHLESVDAMAEILFAEELDEIFGREQTPKPVPFVVVADKQTDVGVACLIKI